jgi:hypothetical protein
MPRIESVPKARYRVYRDRTNEFATQMDRTAVESALSSV